MTVARIVWLAVILTVATLAVWLSTGGDYYTKFHVVEKTVDAVDADDPLAGTGFYDDEAGQESISSRDEFRLGLLPTPQGLFDKHLLSVATLLGLVWGASLLTIWRVCRGRNPAHAPLSRVLENDGIPHGSGS